MKRRNLFNAAKSLKTRKKKRKTKYFKEISSYRIKKRLKKGRLLK